MLKNDFNIFELTGVNTPMEKEYTMFKFHSLCGSDMRGTYFIQYTDNEVSIDEFFNILEYNTDGDYEFQNLNYKLYKESEVDVLKNYKDLWDMGGNDVVQFQKLSGKFQLPVPNYEEEDVFYEWITANLGDTKHINFKKCITKVEDLGT